MYLLDTNIWLERLLDQDRSEEVRHLIEQVNPERLHITAFSLYSIGIILSRLGETRAFTVFVRDLLLDGGVRCIRLDPSQLVRTAAVIDRFGLDFDDAYQYCAAEQHELELVSFDADFDRTDLRRRTPQDILRR
ncbi:MAG: PIN domain-containing protein [Bacteroidetes bacterium]|jgi:predicted nucleic acid-binding protein|nr:PIN domain-containing protein [Bacteroidota bacterium]